MLYFLLSVVPILISTPTGKRIGVLFTILIVTSLLVF